jgi:hypothetical protein
MRTKLNKIKIFKDSSISKLEKTINAWFEKNKYIEIVRILQSETVVNKSSDDKNGNFNRTITICYKELEEPPSAAIVDSADFSKEKLDNSIKV